MFWSLLLTLGVILVLWLGYRWAERIGAERERERVARRRRPGPRKPRQVEELVECAVCGDFVAGDSGPCGRDGCPFA